MDIGPSELIIILAIVLLLFGGKRLAGLGKSAGRALKEFKDETKELAGSTPVAHGTVAPSPSAPTATTTAAEPERRTEQR